uniref:Uncharacterized protein n=1 Tax=Physcomitrium patens TaxID=3218 RepID=A0A2K1K243_PHYPA|nr:hypothetical protein PHYPA_012321 [Physcomitrium patens]
MVGRSSPCRDLLAPGSEPISGLVCLCHSGFSHGSGAVFVLNWCRILGGWKVFGIDHVYEDSSTEFFPTPSTLKRSMDNSPRRPSF